MKKGAIELEHFADMILHIIPLVILLGVIALFAYYYFFPAPTDAQKDFNRIIDDLENLIEEKASPTDLELPVPLQAKEGYIITVFSKGQPTAPVRCKGNNCICVIEQEAGQNKETCKDYPKLMSCADTTTRCGTYCFQPTLKRIEKDKPTTFTITRGCNSFTFA